MLGDFALGVFSVLILSTFLCPIFGGGFDALFMIPCMAGTLGCWIFTIITFCIYLFTDSIYWLTIAMLFSVSCLSFAMFCEINPAKYNWGESAICFFIALVVTVLFIFLPYIQTKILFGVIAFAVLVYNLYLQNGGEFKGICNLYNYRFLEDCLFMYFFPVPLLIFFIATCFI